MGIMGSNLIGGVRFYTTYWFGRMRQIFVEMLVVYGRQPSRLSLTGGTPVLLKQVPPDQEDQSQGEGEESVREQGRLEPGIVQGRRAPDDVQPGELYPALKDPGVTPGDGVGV